MTVTAFGSLFLSLTFFILLLRRAWLLPLLCVAAVLQSPSVFDVTLGAHRFGATPFLVVGVVVAFDLARRCLRQRGLTLGPAPVRPVVLLWLSFGLLSLLGAVLLPWLFAGETVFSPIDKQGVHVAQVALAPSLSNVGQVVNLLLLATALLWIVQQHADPTLPQRMLRGMVAAVLVSALVGLQQRLAWNGLLPLWDGFWASNPTYAQNYRSFAGPVPRVSWPLVEASYGSAWYAAALGGFVTMFLASVRRHWALLGAMVAGFALGNSLGATGLLAAMLFGAITLVTVLVLAVRHPRLRGGLAYQVSLGALVCACVLLTGWLILRHYALLDAAALAVQHILQGRRETVLGDLRPQADAQALTLLLHSWGLGVGMGSNRASGYLATLAGNVGVPGLLLFGATFGLQLRLLVQRVRTGADAPTLFFLGGSVAGLLAVAIAIPDQNWPVFWLLILGGVACLMAQRVGDAAASRASQPARHAETHDGAI